MTLDWALGLSCGALIISILSFGWNVWSKFIYPKPKLLVDISLMHVIRNDRRISPSVVVLSVTNFGPAQVVIYSSVAKGDGGKDNSNIMLLTPCNNYPEDLGGSGPFGNILPRKIDVGEEFQIFFPVVKSWFEKDKVYKIGVRDTFQRFHWVERKRIKKFRESVLNSENKNDQ